jgi:hypothetical protein
METIFMNSDNENWLNDQIWKQQNPDWREE